MAEDFVGARIRYWRLKRGLSQRALAGLAGLSQAYISQVESGLREIDRRSTLVRIADALKVSVADLAGQPFAPDDPQHARALAAVPEIRAALAGLAYLDLAPEPVESVEHLTALVNDLTRHRRLCEYANAAHLIAPLVRDLGATAYGHRSPKQLEGLRLLTLTTYHTAFVLKYLGFVDLSLTAAERCHDAARELDSPEWVGLAEYTRLHTLPPESRAVGRTLAITTVDRLARDLSSPDVMQTYGMMHLSAAWTDVVSSDKASAEVHLAEASDVADRLGPDPQDGGFAEMQFGPTNVAHWRMSLALEAGEAGRAIELARAINPQAILSTSRRASFHMDVGQALAVSRHRDAEALAQFVQAERIAPQRVRLSPVVRDTVGAMMRRARADAGGDQLRGMAARLGVA